MKLPRNLSVADTWGFGLSGLLLWLGTAPAMHAALGPQAIFVWLPATLVGMLLNFQVKRLGTYYPAVSGGTPNYLTRLLKDFPTVARYSAIGYLLGWASVPPVNAIILTDLIKTQLDTVNVACPVMPLRIGFTLIPFIVAATGTRALGTLHTFFVVPATGFLLVFCCLGLGWLGVAPTSPGLLPADWGDFSVIEWLKWFFIAVYAAYGGESSSSYVADSRHPSTTLKCLKFVAVLLPVVYLGGSWILMQLATDPNLSDSAFLTLVAAARPFWGDMASVLVTFLIGSGCLLSSATAVSNSPRILYQLARDRFMAPVFGVVSRRGAFIPGLLYTLFFSLGCLVWGDLTRVVMVTGTSYLTAMMAMHWGQWLRRGSIETRWPKLSLVFLVVEAIVLVVGGLAWSPQDLAIGLLLPVGMMAIDAIIRRIPLPYFHPKWWFRHYKKQSDMQLNDIVFVQVIVLIMMVCLTTIISWGISYFMQRIFGYELLIMLLLSLSYVAVAIACWTILPHVIALDEAREAAEILTDELENQVEERSLKLGETNQALEAEVVERRMAEFKLQEKNQSLEVAFRELKSTQTQLIQSEKMSSLGQLVAGVAHEINNPVSFIHGNINHANKYIQDLLDLLSLYQCHYPNPEVGIQAKIKEMDLAFVQQDLLKLLGSMTIGTDRIREIVLSLRTFSRLDESGFKQVDLHDGIDSTLLILQSRLRGSDTKLIKNYGNLPLVECYAGQMNQVFMNIIANAIDSLESCQEDCSVVPTITILTETKGDRVQIKISDNGAGISEAVQARLFDPFFTTKPVGKGTGLGLSISYQIVTERHRGKLWCNSTPGQGTTFVIEIPVAIPSSSLLASTPSNAPS